MHEDDMGIERAGLRRLYDCLGCGIKGEQDVNHSFHITQDGEVFFYLGPKPPLGVVAFESSDVYYLPGKQAKMLQTISNYKSDCFLEIAVSFTIPVDKHVSMGLAKQEEEAKAIILNEVEKNKSTFTRVLDTICGLVGLRFHRQFILKQLVENSFIASAPVPVSRFSGDIIEMLDPIRLNEFGLASLKSYLDSLGKLEGQHWTEMSRVFQWLLRAWRERDHVAKFLYLFIPSECILGSSDEIGEEARTRIASLKDLVVHSEDNAKKDLLRFLDRVESKFGPTLNARFESLAMEKQIDGWEADIKAFKEFNRTRNLLLHAGKAEVQSHLDIGQETRTLEDLVERYVAVSVFGNPGVYASRWRPLRGHAKTG
jgi:hypothetical protein